jgi:ribosomal protein L37E
MSDENYQTDKFSSRSRGSTYGIANNDGWRCRVCGHTNLAETEYCSKCGYRLDAQRYFK